MKEQLISVIVIAYNIEKLLPRCMDSVLAQTYPNLEIILIDDGSTDSTGAICDNYGKEHEKVTVIHRQNGGISAARNSGLAIAKGDFIGYVDGDDYIEPTMYETMYKACMEHDAKVAVCTYREEGEGATPCNPTGNIIPLTREEALEWYVNGHEKYRLYNSVWSKLFSREVVGGVLFPEGRNSEDIMYTTRALAKADKSVFVDEALYHYIVSRQDSVMNQRLAERRFGDEIPFWREQEQHLSGLGMQEFADKSAYRFYRKMLFYYIDFCDRKMFDSAAKLAGMLRSEKERIREVYGRDFVATGDKVRMKVFLTWPKGYYHIVRLYEKLVIPLRQ
ncbi:MAG: glycosyltransferase [Lachnospiraceae bacterium]|nr:glycosyltransferase [Lachnospiraceae bacterium]